jgi:hypothetical protein
VDPLASAARSGTALTKVPREIPWMRWKGLVALALRVRIRRSSRQRQLRRWCSEAITACRVPIRAADRAFRVRSTLRR